MATGISYPPGSGPRSLREPEAFTDTDLAEKQNPLRKIRSIIALA
jgi:hypothetical protein